jgi:ankyrin repeat protein
MAVFYQKLETICRKMHKQSALHIAAELKLTSFVQWLLTNNLVQDINKVNNSHYTALHIAAGSNNLELVQLLVEHSANPALPQKMNKTALNIAEGRNFPDVVHYLRQYSVPRFSQGSPPLEVSSFRQVLSDIQQTQQEKADESAPDKPMFRGY